MPPHNGFLLPGQPQAQQLQIVQAPAFNDAVLASLVAVRAPDGMEPAEAVAWAQELIAEAIVHQSRIGKLVEMKRGALAKPAEQPE